ncbi:MULTISPECIES: nucleoside-diphosphate kinase [unclassified Streptomyces]|uniref:nucleoside-diphosphate kinase n=1 Tax=unclassified Streptomyces TaxID=2593676 RepID=UPI002253C96D|nr:MULTISPECIES: nucleoside-diphosphate kinase [unclassified Streptomyces]MCX4527010.1 nucleoside-diphosphate kinase [Streptomyces sp. NBC_01551]MCX4542430.1 nucleoside-diphosphate kinase [Streptomyces sp. NBC_01565]
MTSTDVVTAEVAGDAAATPGAAAAGPGPLPGDGRSAVSPRAFDALTADPAKRAAYRLDTYAREGLDLFRPPGDRAWLYATTFVVLKPDAFAGRRCGLILDILEEEGWLPIAAHPLRFDPLLTREIWRYQFNAASAQRIAVVDHLLGSGPSLLVLLRDTRRAPGLPASVRLTAAKGAADPGAAHGRDLRTRFGRVNGLFNFVHTADEPADLVRELRLFGYRTGASFLRSALGAAPAQQGEPCPARALLPELEREIPAHDLDVTRSLDRLAARDDGWGELARLHAAPERVGRWLEELETTELPEGGARWDVLSVLTGWIECNEPGVAPLLATVAATDWRNNG